MKKEIKNSERYDSTVLKAQNEIEELLTMSTDDSDYSVYFKVFPGQETKTGDSKSTTAA
ncbi:hypothetical protein KAJ27_18680 [bacterium]|nr:hypothetical protein [bacterium]